MKEHPSNDDARLSIPNPAPGSVVGGRFLVDQPIGQDSLGAVFAGHDQKTGRAISLRILARQLVASQPAIEALRDEVRMAATIDHKNVVHIFGMGQALSETWFIAGERVDGIALTDLIADRARHGVGLSLRNATQIAMGIAQGLSAAREISHHGALRPSVVWVSSGARVRVGDFGISRAILRTSGARAFGATEQGYLSPEVKAGSIGDVASDVFGLGAVLYSLLTARSPTDAFVTPSSVHPEVTPDVDALLMRALSSDPSERFATPEELVEALVQFASSAPASTLDEVEAPIAARRGSVQSNVKAQTSSAGRRVAADASFRQIPQAVAAPATSIPPVFDPESATGNVDLSAALARITENDAPRWMVVKDGLDHGPFSGRELVQAIVAGEVKKEHGLLNLDTGARTKVGETPDFVGIVAEAAKAIRTKQQAAAVAHSEKRELRGNAAKIGIALVVVVLMVASAGLYLLARPDADDEDAAARSADDLYQRGRVKLEVSAGILPDPPPQKGGRRAGGARPGGGGGTMSYEDAMSVPMDLGDVSEGGGSMRQLTREQVAATVNQNMGRFNDCIDAEVRTGTRGRAGVDIAIAGSGNVMGVSVRAGSGAFQQCVASRMRGVRFPSFPAPRMGARVALPLE